MGLFSQFRNFDVYQKTHSDFKDQWLVGAIISVASLTVCAVLAWGEWSIYRTAQQRHTLYVDTEVDGKLPVHVNITFPVLPCSLLSLDAVDAFGETQLDVDRSVFKTRLSKEGHPLEKSKETVGEDGKVDDHLVKEATHLAAVTKEGYCGSCYGAEEQEGACCNTCQAVRDAYAKKGWLFELFDTIEQCVQERLDRLLAAKNEEGCNIQGDLLVNKVQGNLHFSPGRSFQTGGVVVHDYIAQEVSSFNTSHVIHKLGFGTEFPGLVNPLDGRKHLLPRGESGLFQFYLKVVPTRFERLNGDHLETNQYSVSEHFRRRTPANQVVPGVFFIYDLSPIKVHIKETHAHKSFLHFLTSLCAAVGGVFTVAGLIDSLLYHGHSRLAGKGD
eukprot:TRINITY_DN71134_c0_g1_i1.p1 TRINITY_DN71134_c0_g1~~TRINITY_DN71134_c0_g1_i1.p1  ORF type:complete len:418 (+),score=146.60 TRINITY_DN71134_c0_g1_i1:97-1254(+)